MRTLTMNHSLLLLFGLLVTVPVLGHGPDHPGETPEQSLAWLELAETDLHQAPAIGNQAFVYDVVEDDFELTEFLGDHAPWLLPHQEAISHWSGYASIHPRILLTLMEQHASTLSQPDAINEQRPFGSLSDHQGFDEQLEDVAMRLSQRFHNLQSLRPTESPAMALQANQASLSSASLTLASSFSTTDPTADTRQELEEFAALYGRLFPEAKARLLAHDGLQMGPRPQADASLANTWLPPANLMQMPWRQGYRWIANGAHAHSGSGFPLSSIDVSYDWPWWYAPTYSVAAAHDGRVSVFSRCQVRVTHPNGWATNYYHLDNVEVRHGQWVNRNTKLADYASAPRAALCQGGRSTGPHLHFSLLYQGQYRSLQNVNLGPYRVNVGNYSYDNNCGRFWFFNQRQGRYQCAWQSLYNYGARD